VPVTRFASRVALLATMTSVLMAGCASARLAPLPMSTPQGIPIDGACRAPPRRSTPREDSSINGLSAPGEAPDEASAWTYHALAFLWVPGVKGEAGRGDAVSKSDVSVGDMADVLKNTLERALLTHVEARTDGWGLFANVIALELEDDSSTTRVFGPVKLPNGRVVAPRRTIDVKTDATLKMTIAEVGASLDLTDELMGDDGSPMRVEALVGARYYDMGLDLELNHQTVTDDGEDWVDAFVGARTNIKINDAWDLNVRGDVGGFGIGTSSDRAWRATGLVRYQPWERTAIFAGWNHLDIDWDRGSGASEAVFDMRFSGPILGFTYDF
jgi:hypothetical protein